MDFKQSRHVCAHSRVLIFIPEVSQFYPPSPKQRFAILAEVAADLGGPLVPPESQPAWGRRIAKECPKGKGGRGLHITKCQALLHNYTEAMLLATRNLENVG